MSEVNWQVLAAAIVVLAAVVGVYAFALYNHLGRRLENLRRLAADVRDARDRRFSVGGVVDRRLRQATEVDRSVARAGRAPRGAGRGVYVHHSSQTNPASVATVGAGMSADIQGVDRESEARRQLNLAAEEYNSELRMYPQCLLAPLMGYRPWRLGNQGGPKHRRPRFTGAGPRPHPHPRRWGRRP